MASARLAKEYSNLLREKESLHSSGNVPQLEIELADPDSEHALLKWNVAMGGPIGSVFEQDPCFFLEFEFTEMYPIQPPKVRFVSRLKTNPPPKHEHVYSNGDICLSILDVDWSPSIGVKGILLSIVSMLSSAEEKRAAPNDARYVRECKIVSNISWQYHDDKC